MGEADNHDMTEEDNLLPSNNVMNNNNSSSSKFDDVEPWVHSASNHSLLSHVEPHNPLTQKLFAIFGGLALFLSVGIWIAQAEMLQGVQSNQGSSRAIVLTYWNRTSYSLMAIPLVFWDTCRKLCFSESRKTESAIKFLPSWNFIKNCVGLNCFAYFCDVLWANSLKATSVAANTAIYNSLPLFVLIFSVILLDEKITWRKCVSVFVGITGLIIISLISSGGGETTPIGIILVVGSTILFAFYTVMSKRWNDEFFLDTSEGRDVDDLEPKESNSQSFGILTFLHCSQVQLFKSLHASNL
jgi:drug/metabolite transporter (DMT)-like permease